MNRCGWATEPDMARYHDEEWGVPVFETRALFELLTLEAAQAGLSWATILRKRAGYQQHFLGFDLAAVAAMGTADVERLMQEPGIVRNRAKIEATIQNAGAILAMDDFPAFVWSFVDGSPLVNRWSTIQEVPGQTDASKKMSKALLAKGFRFVGPTICYSFMQASGMVNDHVLDCFRHGELAAHGTVIR